MIELLKHLRAFFIIAFSLMFACAYPSQPDNLWNIIRHHFSLKACKEEEPLIAKHIAWYQKHPESLTTTIERSSRYLHYITATLVSEKAPTELALIPMIESHYDPFAYSHAGARGLWQFMPSLASGYGLKQDHWIDERRDIVLSTHTALSHLQYLHKLFQNDWKMAIYAYNGGEGRVKKTLKLRKDPNQTLQFLPQETRAYLPKIFALQRIIQNPQKYGFTLPSIPNAPYFITISSTKTLAFDQIRDICHIDTDTLRALNPAARRSSIYSTPEKPSHILLPANQALTCQQKLLNTSTHDTWKYITPDADTHVQTIAKTHQTAISHIRSLNWIPDHQTQSLPSLLIEKRKRNHQKTTLKLDLIAADTLPGPKQILHTTTAHDTLQSIASRYHTTKDKIIYWNKKSKLAPLVSGQKIIIWQNKLTTRYTVQSGDTLWSIAKKYRTDVTTLQRINKLSCTALKHNQTLDIPSHASY